jgi:hypothetical protein
LIKYLKDSFDYSNRVLATLTANNALDRVEGRYAGPNTKLGISVIAVWNITDHYGQLVAYLRLNGIVPPFTQKYGEGSVSRSGTALRLFRSFEILVSFAFPTILGSAHQNR